MKIKLPIALRSALLAAMAFTAGTAYADPYDPSQSPGPIGTEVSGLLVGSSAPQEFTINSNLTVLSDAVVGAGDRAGVSGGNGSLIITGPATVTVNGSVYAGASGVNSFPGYVTSNANGGDGSILLNSGATLTVGNALRLGWLDGKTGTMTVDASTVTASGQIVLGFYNQPGGLSLNTTGNLDIRNDSKVTSSREIFVASGTLTLNSSEISAKHLEIAGIESSAANFNSSSATFDSILVGAHRDNASMQVSGNGGSVRSNGGFQISAGRLDVDTQANLIVQNDAWFGNKVSIRPGSVLDTFVTIDGAQFESSTLSIWKDAQLTASNSAGIEITKSMQMEGLVVLNTSARLEILSNLYMDDGAQITVDNAELKVSGATESAGTTKLTVTGSGVNLGQTTVSSGLLTLNSPNTGTIATGDLVTTKGNLEIGNSVTLSASSASVAAGTSLSIADGGKADIAGSLNLNGNLSTKGELDADTLTLNEGAVFTVDSTGKLGIGKTEINSDFVLTNTGNNGGTLGAVTLADGVSLGLSGNNRTTSLSTGGNNTVTVSGSGNELGAVTVDAVSKLLVQGDTTVASLTNNGDVSVTKKLTITGIGEEALQLNGGTTTVSGSIVGDNVVWKSANTPVTLLINGDTADNSTMLALKSGLLSSSIQVNVDLTGGISGLSGKTVTFAKNESQEVVFDKTAENFKFLSSGSVTEEKGEGTHISVTQEVGSSKLVFGYTVTNGVMSDGTNWEGTGITFDRSSSSIFIGEEDQKGKTIQVDTVVRTTDNVKDNNSNSYGHVELASSGSQYQTGDTIVSRNVAVNGGDNSALSVSSQIVTLYDANEQSEGVIATGMKTMEVTDETIILGVTGTGTSQVGGLKKGETIITEEGKEITTDRIAQLNIAAGKKLSIESANLIIDRTIAMGTGSTISAKNAEITIGTTEETLNLTEDVSFEIPVEEADGTVVMKTVHLSENLNQKSLDNVSLVLEDSTFKFDQFKTTEGAGEAAKVIAVNDKVVFNNANISMKKTDTGTMELGGGTSQMILNNSTVSGTGTLNNIVMNGGTLKIGNSPGIMTMEKCTYSGVAINFMIDPSMTTGGMLNNQVTGENAMMSQLNVTDTTYISGSVNIYMETKNADGSYTALSNSSTQYLDNLAVGTSFQFITGLDNLAAGSSFTLGSMPTLEDGLVWDITKIGVDGTVSIARGSYADAMRIANTLVSAGETVSGFGQMSRTHVYDVRLNGTNVWVNGLGTFLNHSSHNGRSGFDYNAGGYAVGADTIVNNKAIVGLAFGQSFGKHTPKAGNRFYDAGKIDMDSVMFGLYGGTSFAMKSPSDSMKLDAYASYGRFDNDSRHHSLTTGQAATASWKENAYAVGATLTRVHEVRENLFFSPFVSLDYIYADMDSFTESAAQTISYEGTAYQNLSMSVGTGLTRVYHLNGGQELSPYVSVAYVGDLVRKDAKVTSRNSTGALVERSVSPGRNAFQVNVGAGWKVTENWGARVGYTAEFRSGATDQGVTVGVNYAF